MSVRMVHPDLPGQPIDVRDPLAVQIHERSGWRLENVRDRPAPQPAHADVPDGHVAIVHPGSGQETVVPAESIPTLRASGWLTKAERDENERQAAEAAQGASKVKAARPAASKEE